MRASTPPTSPTPGTPRTPGTPAWTPRRGDGSPYVRRDVENDEGGEDVDDDDVQRTDRSNGTPLIKQRADDATASPSTRSFRVDDFMRVEDIAKGEREWRDVRPCVRKAIEGMAYVLRRHDRGVESARRDANDARRRVEEVEASRMAVSSPVVSKMSAGRELDVLKLELAEARHDAAERRVEALEDTVRQLRDELHSSRAIHAATLDRISALETLQASTASKISVDIFELETQIGVKATEGAEAAAKAVDARLEAMSSEVSDVSSLVRELEVEVQETRMKANQTALSLAAADVPSIASEMEIIKARAARASQDANFVNEALVEVRQLAENVERLSDECNGDVKRVREHAGDVNTKYDALKETMEKAGSMDDVVAEYIERIEARGQATLDRIERDVQRISDLGNEIASTSEQHAHLVQEQGELLASQLKDWGAKVVERVSEKAESTVTEVMQERLREIESSTDSASARNAERAAQETRKCVQLAEEAMRKADDENNAFKESVLSSITQMKAASERADELKQWINKQFTSFAEIREDSIAALRGSEKTSVEMLSKVAEEHLRSMKRVLGEAEASRGITDAGFKTRIDRLDERFEKFEARVSASELRVESCEVSMKLEKAASKPNAEAQALAIAAVEKSVQASVSAMERDLREEIKHTAERLHLNMRKEIMPVHDAVFGAAYHEHDSSPAVSPLSTPRKSTHLDVYVGSSHSNGGSMSARLAALSRKQDEQGMIIQSMHESMERTVRDRPSTSSVREMFDQVSKRVDAIQEVSDWEKVERNKTKQRLTEMRKYVDERVTKMEASALRDFQKLGIQNAEMHVPRDGHSADYGRKYVTHPELQAAISIVEEHIKRISRKMRGDNSVESDETSADGDLISF